MMCALLMIKIARYARQIDAAKKLATTIGGVVQTIIEGVPVGIGVMYITIANFDGRIAQGVVSINAFKGKF